MNAAEIKMSVSKESEFKLFGKTIALPEKNRIPVKSVTGCQNPDKSELMDACSETTKAESEEDTTAAECDGKPNKCYNFGNHKEEEEQTVTLMQETHLNPKPKEDQVETNSRDRDQEEGFKRPDKILQCPRCHSCDTKFCYFNNYNVNQPRHYCKNCQRYWTAGGAMRKVAFGAGRRKNKHLASQYSLVMVSSDAVPTSGTESSYSANHQLLAYEESTTTLLKIGSEAPFSESMERLPNLIGQKRCADNGSVNVREKGEEPSSSGSSMTASSLLEQNLHEKNLHKEQVGLQGSCNTFPPPHPFSCYPVPSWALPWNPNATHMAAASCSSESVYTPESYKSNSVQWGSTPMMAVPGLHNPSIPLQFVPTSYPGCMPIWPGNKTGIINLAAGANGCLSPSSSTTNSCSGNGSPTLGKHSRDVNTFDDEKIGKVYCGSTINYPNK